jgi:hypothetical protein
MSVGGDDYRQAKPIITQHRHHAHAILGRSLAWQANPIRAGAAASAGLRAKTGMTTGMGWGTPTRVLAVTRRHAPGMSETLVDAVIVGAGFSGLYATHHLRTLRGLSV